MAAKLRKGDSVVVLAGKDKGKKGDITRVMPKDNKAIVAGVNVAIRHAKQTQSSQGGRIAREMPIDLSNATGARLLRIAAPGEPRLILPGFALAYSTISLRLRYGSSVRPTTMVGW